MSALQKICLMIGFAAALILGAIPADAVLFLGGSAGSSSPSGQITTLDIVNTSSSTQAANFVTQVFGHPFKKGDIANGCTGSAPIFQTTGGTNVPFSEGLKPVCWGDGSLEWAPFLLKVPVSINGDYTIASTGSSYTSSTGAIVIALTSTPSFTTGQRVNIDLLTGTGNWGAITGTYTVTNVSGNNVSMTGYTGFGSTTITGGTLYQAVTINVLSGGTTPTTSGFSASNLTASSHDPNVQVTGMSNLSGTYVSDLAKGISDANFDNYAYIDGQAGRVERLRECFRLTNTSGSCQGQLNGYYYIQELPNSTGGFGYARWMMRLAQPWYDQTGNDYRTFSAFATYDGVTQSKNIMGSGTPYGVAYNFDWDNGDGTFTSSSYTNGGAFIMQASNTGGSLPTGISTATDYFQRPNSPTNTTWFSLFNGTSSGASQVYASTSCTGTCTFTAYPYLIGFGSIFTANTNGSYDFFQGAGSVSSDSHVRITFNNTYWRSTRMIPPYAIGTAPATPYENFNNGTLPGGENVNHVITYYPNSLGSTDVDFNSTGESDWIGPEPMWVASHALLQDSQDEQLIRVSSLNGAGQPVMLLNSSTGTIPVVNAGTYSGMPSSQTGLFWTASSSAGGAVVNSPGHSTIWMGQYAEIDFSHMEEFDYYALLAFGNPEYMDNLLNWGDTAIIDHLGGLFPGAATVNATENGMGGISSNGSSERYITVSGTPYYIVGSEFSDLARQEAWQNRTAGMALALASSYGPAAASTHQYLNDMLTAQFEVESAYISLLPANAQALGTFNEASSGATGVSQGWAQGYQMMATSYISAINDTPSWGQLTLGNFMAKFWKFEDQNIGAWGMPTYEYLQRDYNQYNNPTAGSQDYGPYLTSNANFAICGAGGVGPGSNWTITWTNSSGSPASTFTFATYPTNYVPTNGDVVRFWLNFTGTPPAAFTGYGVNGYWYSFYMVNANSGAQQFQLSATSGGSAIAMTDTNTGGEIACVAPYGMKSATTTSISNIPLGSGYMQNETGALNWWDAVGGTVDATTLSDMNSNLSAIGGTVPYSVKYDFLSHF